MADVPETLVFYESPQRLLRLMKDILDIMGDRKAVVARELTKLHEETIRGTLGELIKELSGRATIKGECCLLVEGWAKQRGFDRQAISEHLRSVSLEKERTLSDLVKEVSKRFGISRKAVYEEALKLDDEDQVPSD